METKYCHKCGEHKPIDQFYKNNRGGCKKCIRAYQKKYYEEHYAPEKVTDPEGFRTCSKCRDLKPVAEFYRDKSNVSGYNHRCKVCSDALREARRQKEKTVRNSLKEVLPEGFKRCNKCKEVLPISEFRQVKSGPKTGRYYSPCQTCLKLYREQNRDKIAERSRAYKQKPGVREREMSRKREWVKNNPDYWAKQKAYRIKYNQRQDVKAKNKAHNANYRTRPENQEKARQRTVEWRKTNPEKENHNALIKHYRKKNAEGTHTYDQWLTLLTFYHGYCPCCGKKRVLTRDHIIPLNKGGTNWISNIQGLCRSCNAAKQDHHATDYRPESARLWADSEMTKMGLPANNNDTSFQIQQLRFSL